MQLTAPAGRWVAHPHLCAFYQQYGGVYLAGYTAIYCIGGEGGFQGADGINPIFFQILVGDGNRRWLEVHYFDQTIRPIGNVSVIVPESPESQNALLDACLAFFPQHFEQCASLAEVKETLAEATHLDLGSREIPLRWNHLREEARPLLSSLNIYFAALEPMQV